jgi:hypothetical protein
MNLHVEVKLKTNTTWSEQVQKFNPKNQSETKINGLRLKHLSRYQAEYATF